MMNRTKLLFIFILFAIGTLVSFSCTFPPDIVHEFRIDTASGKVKVNYSLLSWRNLHAEVLKDLESRVNIHVKDENLEKIFREAILSSTTLTYNNREIDLIYTS